mgnify:FL=1
MKRSTLFLIHEDLYLKEPSSKKLGRAIISKSIDLIFELGFEKFNFKKLGDALGSNESSVYRYFKNKHFLLLYLINWYWSWINHRITKECLYLNNPQKKLELAIEIVTSKITKDDYFEEIDEEKLNQIIIIESSKAYHNINIDKENEKGYYSSYKSVVEMISQLIHELKPDYQYPNMLTSTIIEGAHHQHYFKDHLPDLTNQYTNSKNELSEFYKTLVLKTLEL